MPNESRVCPNDHQTLQVRLDDDGNVEFYCPRCSYWEYTDYELNIESAMIYP